MHYIMVMRDRTFWLVGPFETQDKAGDWGRANNPEDDPRWQTMELHPFAPGDTVEVMVVSPDDGPMVGGKA